MVKLLQNVWDYATYNSKKKKKVGNHNHVDYPLDITRTGLPCNF